MITVQERIDEIYESLKRSARGSWNYDASTMTLVIDLGGDNVITMRVPDRNLGSFLARSSNRIAWLLEALYQHKEIALGLMEEPAKRAYEQMITEKLEPSEAELDDLETQTLQEDIPGPEAIR